jgi:hypothetical protein
MGVPCRGTGATDKDAGAPRGAPDTATASTENSTAARGPLRREPFDERATEGLEGVVRTEEQPAQPRGLEIERRADVLEGEGPELVTVADPPARLRGELHPFGERHYLANQAANCVNQNRTHEGALRLGSGGEFLRIADSPPEP